MAQQTLTDYLTQTQRLLHDSTNRFWSQAELVDYINQGRREVVGDAKCNRVLQQLPSFFSAGAEGYPVSSLPTQQIIDIINVTVLWGSSRYPMAYMPFTQFNAQMRTYNSAPGRPSVWTYYGSCVAGATVYVQPVPDQTYKSEWDTVVLPADLVNLSDQCILQWPYTKCVSFYAAYLAKFNERRMEEAEEFAIQYKKQWQRAIVQQQTRRLLTPYQRP